VKLLAYRLAARLEPRATARNAWTGAQTAGRMRDLWNGGFCGHGDRHHPRDVL